MTVQVERYGRMPDGTEINRFILENSNGVSVGLLEYGAIVESIIVPDKDGQKADIALGFDNLDDWVKRNDPHFGSTIGRYANRIGNGRFSLDGIEYQLAINNGPNCLHGGNEGFDQKVWSSEQIVSAKGPSVKLSRTSPDGEENFPGNLDCSVQFTLTNENELIIDYKAETDQATIVNLTNHTYFNLGGHDAGYVGNHVVSIDADRYTPTDENGLPIGKIETLNDNPLDLRQPLDIDSRIDEVGGYDNNYVLKEGRQPSDTIARVEHPASGRALEVATTEPGLQFYTGNSLDGIAGKGGATYEKQNALCLEAQQFPDAINHNNFPNVILRPGEKYRHTTIYRFR